MPPPCHQAQLETPGKTKGEQIQVTSNVCDLMMESCCVSHLQPQLSPPWAHFAHMWHHSQLLSQHLWLELVLLAKHGSGDAQVRRIY